MDDRDKRKKEREDRRLKRKEERDRLLENLSEKDKGGSTPAPVPSTAPTGVTQIAGDNRAEEEAKKQKEAEERKKKAAEQEEAERKAAEAREAEERKKRDKEEEERKKREREEEERRARESEAERKRKEEAIKRLEKEEEECKRRAKEAEERKRNEQEERERLKAESRANEKKENLSKEIQSVSKEIDNYKNKYAEEIARTEKLKLDSKAGSSTTPTRSNSDPKEKPVEEKKDERAAARGLLFGGARGRRSEAIPVAEKKEDSPAATPTPSTPPTQPPPQSQSTPTNPPPQKPLTADATTTTTTSTSMISTTTTSEGAGEWVEVRRRGDTEAAGEQLKLSSKREAYREKRRSIGASRSGLLTRSSDVRKEGDVVGGVVQGGGVEGGAVLDNAEKSGLKLLRRGKSQGDLKKGQVLDMGVLSPQGGIADEKKNKEEEERKKKDEEKKKKEEEKKKKEEEKKKKDEEKKKKKEDNKKKKEEDKRKKKEDKDTKKKGGQDPDSISIYNSTLEDVMLAQQATSQLEVPLIVKTLTEAIFTLKGHELEGIFRLSANGAEVEELKGQLNKRNYQIPPTTDPHVVANCLKVWLNSLAAPLIPNDFYEACIQSSRKPEDILKIIACIPKINKDAVLFIVDFLIELEKSSAKTMMGVENLATVFSPGFLRCTDPSKMLLNTTYESLFMQNIIEARKKSK